MYIYIIQGRTRGALGARPPLQVPREGDTHEGAAHLILHLEICFKKPRINDFVGSTFNFLAFHYLFLKIIL